SVVTFTSTQAYLGSLDRQVLNFQHFELASVNLKANNDSVLYRQLDLSFGTTQNYILGYNTIFSASANMDGNSISRSDYAKGNFFLVFDLQNTALATTITPESTGSLQI